MNQLKTKTDNTGEHRTSYRLAMGLVLLALLAVLARLLWLGPAQLAGGDRLWRLVIEASVQANAQATAIRLYPPLETQHLRVIQRTLHHPGFRIRNWSEDRLERRSILAFASSSGKKNLHTEFVIHQLASPNLSIENRPVLLSNSQREKLLQDTINLQLSNPLVSQTLKSLSLENNSRPELINSIFNYLQKFKVSYKKDELNVPVSSSSQQATQLDRHLAMVALCRAAGFPSRIVTGLLLKEDIDPQPHYWAEVYLDDRWLAYDIVNGYRQTVPLNYLPLRRDGFDIAQVLNGELLQLNYDLDREYDHPFLHQFRTKNFFNIFNLDRLSLDARNELAILMLLPLGALITALCRHLAGIHSYGVFTPTLLALAMVYTDVLTTTIIFFIISSLAIGGRSLFPTSITRVPRLAIIFTLVALLMTFAASVMDYYELGQGDKIVLLPIIILTSLVDRLYRTLEDKGTSIAMHRLIWTLLITLLCLPVVQFDSLGHLLLTYPESHLITLALFLLISTYKGKQLINLPLIRWLAEPESKKNRKAKPSDTENNSAS